MTNPPILLPQPAVDRINRGDVDILRDGLRRGLRPDTLWPVWEIPLLHGICLYCPPHAAQMVQAMSEAGHPINLTHQDMPPLLWTIAGAQAGTEPAAQMAARLALLETLLEADPGSLILATMAALRAGYQEAFEMFLRKGCDPNAKTAEGHTLLHEAYQQKNSLAAAALLSAGADPNVVDAQGNLPKAGKKHWPLVEREAMDMEVESLVQHPYLPPAAVPRL